ncbi:uncharacterized protein PV09_07498 [Verruconis gallopava]|uniref:Annexin n=1 Tax=Verruconis gallopava TaxID=253628 RepID=A0A0D2A3J2_9PEZI|nr:uncharacterized protein PV09_07498 [Verruconis gallopava]KIW00975.1 hypothetical protein PV09_07498 [Verruconis gallopava]
MAHTSDDSDVDSDEITMGGYTDLPPEQRPGYKPPKNPNAPAYTTTPYPQWGHNAPSATSYTAVPTRNAPTGSGGGVKFSELKGGFTYTAKPVVKPKKQPTMADMPVPPPQFPGYGAPSTAQMPLPPPPPMPAPPGGFDAIPPPPMPGPPPRGRALSDLPPPPPMPMPMPPSGSRGYDELPPPPGASQIPKGAVIKEVTPGGMKPPSPPKGGLRPHSASFGGGGGRPNLRAPSPSGLGSRMNRLSVSGDRPDIHNVMAGGRPPGSPLLEAYRGTYQQMSPMPSPLMMGRRYEDDDIDDLEPLDRRSSHRDGGRRGSSPKKKPKKSITIYNEQAEEEARAIAQELSSSKPNLEVLIDILPVLSHDQILELRTEYKRVCKIQGLGINIAKHIKLKLHGNFCKICYVTALGRWESEGYWANFWYQSNSSRRELLIESLMGRSNAEIRLIKDAFKDKRYNDDLVRCMDKELKADKFRMAILKALDEQRQEENEQWSIEYRNRDVDDLYKALHRREGGESAILDIVITRSDAHLKEVLKTYERKYGKNFAKEALRKSGNLVGEVVAHILNGVINRPARDAMLLHHALQDLAPTESPRSSRADVNPRSSRSDVRDPPRKDRYELLISRLVRLHWDRMHFMRVKLEYRDKYGHYVEEDIEDYVRGEDFKEFCLVMCESAK